MTRRYKPPCRDQRRQQHDLRLHLHHADGKQQQRGSIPGTLNRSRTRPHPHPCPSRDRIPLRRPPRWTAASCPPPATATPRRIGRLDRPRLSYAACPLAGPRSSRMVGVETRRGHPAPRRRVCGRFRWRSQLATTLRVAPPLFPGTHGGCQSETAARGWQGPGGLPWRSQHQSLPRPPRPSCQAQHRH